MSKPHSGKYLGTFVFAGTASAVQLSLNLRVHDDGSLDGDFTVTAPAGSQWLGPTKGKFNEGNYSPFGTLHLEEEEEYAEKGDATLDGRFEVLDDGIGVIWGTVLIRKDTRKQSGTVALVYAQQSEIQTGQPVGVIADRLWGG